MLLPCEHPVVRGRGCKAPLFGCVVPHLPRDRRVQRDGDVLANHFVKLCGCPVGPESYEWCVFCCVVDQQVYEVTRIIAQSTVGV